jgi:anaerobic selenocysteine-containing dehydrogenase
MLVTVENGKAIKIAGAKDHPTTNGFLCTKVNRYLERTYSNQRVLYPMKRVGDKGKGLFTRISWDEALDTIAEKFKMIAQENPQAILPYSYAGTMGLVQSQSMDRRFFHKLGASLLDRTICASAGAAGYKATIGASIGTDMERFDEAKLIVIWGGNPQTSNVHLMPKILEAKRRGAKLIAIDPYRSLTAEKCQQHIALLPGTDGALALAVMHVIINENLIAAEYIRNYTLGFELLRERVMDYPPSRVAAITGLSEDTIINFAREYATTKPAVIRLNYGMQRHAGGGMAVRNIACLPALIGAWRNAAGGILLSSSGTFSLNTNALERPDFIPPGTRTVVHEIFQTDTADYADIVLPATTQLEQFDVHKAYGHLYVLANNPAIAPLGEAKPNSEVFRLLAQRMGFDDPCFRESDEEIGAQAFNYEHERMKTIDFATLKENGWQRLNVPERYAPFAEGNFPTPSGKCEFFSETLAKQGIDPLPTYIPPRESVQTAPQIAAKYPLAIISPPAHHFLNSSFANLPSFLQAEKEPYIQIHPDDAGVRGIKDGDLVRVYNERGSFQLKARVTDKARPGVVVALSVWWKKLTQDGGNANDVTSQGLTDLGAAATFYDVLVEVEKLFSGEA